MEDVTFILQELKEYQQQFPGGVFKDFCKFYLANEPLKTSASSKLVRPKDADALFMMSLTRSTLAFWVYMRTALKETPLPSIESIMFCAALNSLGESRKTDIVNYAMMEISTGTDILNRLIKKDFIHERIDPKDKRSKLLKLTAAGATALKKCFKKAAMARELFLKDLSDDDKKIVTQILYPLQEKHSRLSIENKKKTIEEIYEAIMSQKNS
jgi:DNA-binding MarR family transcriptional regulator